LNVSTLNFTTAGLVELLVSLLNETGIEGALTRRASAETPRWVAALPWLPSYSAGEKEFGKLMLNKKHSLWVRASKDHLRFGREGVATADKFPQTIWTGKTDTDPLFWSPNARQVTGVSLADRPELYGKAKRPMRAIPKYLEHLDAVFMQLPLRRGHPRPSWRSLLEPLVCISQICSTIGLRQPSRMHSVHGLLEVYSPQPPSPPSLSASRAS
jgi:hypothetical protein